MTYEINPAAEVAKYQALIKEIEFSLSLGKNSLVSHAWIVVDSKSIETAYEFDLEAIPGTNRKRAVNARWAQPHKVGRYTKEDARTLAAACENGNGQCAFVHWRDAAEAYLATTRQVLEMWQDLVDRTAA